MLAQFVREQSTCSFHDIMRVLVLIGFIIYTISALSHHGLAILGVYGYKSSRLENFRPAIMVTIGTLLILYWLGLILLLWRGISLDSCSSGCYRSTSTKRKRQELKWLTPYFHFQRRRTRKKIKIIPGYQKLKIVCYTRDLNNRCDQSF